MIAHNARLDDTGAPLYNNWQIIPSRNFSEHNIWKDPREVSLINGISQGSSNVPGVQMEVVIYLILLEKLFSETKS